MWCQFVYFFSFSISKKRSPLILMFVGLLHLDHLSSHFFVATSTCLNVIFFLWNKTTMKKNKRTKKIYWFLIKNQTNKQTANVVCYQWMNDPYRIFESFVLIVRGPTHRMLCKKFPIYSIIAVNLVITVITTTKKCAKNFQNFSHFYIHWTLLIFKTKKFLFLSFFLKQLQRSSFGNVYLTKTDVYTDGSFRCEVRQ